jgi:hypothetical protein
MADMRQLDDVLFHYEGHVYRPDIHSTTLAESKQ